MEPILIDTNLLVYVYDRRDRARQETATQLIRNLVKASIGRLSAQCLSEFFSATTKQKGQNAPILSILDAANETAKLARTFAIYPVTQQVVLEALRGVRQYQLQFWDAQIWAAAHLNQVPIIFSEDYRAGGILEGVRYVNPFTPDFHLLDWVAR